MDSLLLLNCSDPCGCAFEETSFSIAEGEDEDDGILTGLFDGWEGICSLWGGSGESITAEEKTAPIENSGDDRWLPVEGGYMEKEIDLLDS